MKIEIINTGNELLIGTTLNTHGAWMGQELLKMGLRVNRQVTVSDGDAIGGELERSLKENDVVIITGGLGPTSDDLTREETAKALGLELIEDEFATRTIKEFFSSRGRKMAECNLKQGLCPCGADILPNDRGTAPGVYVPPRLGNSACAVFLLPGPPFELKPMFFAEVMPRLEALTESSQEVKKMQVLSFLGLGESDLHEKLDASLNAIPGLEVGYCARPSDIDLRLIGTDQALTMGRELVLQSYADKCYSQVGESIEKVVVDLLIQQGKKITTAESCTGGAIASRLTDVPGSSGVFEYGYVTYANKAKTEQLGVPEELIDAHGAVSEQVAVAMAEGALTKSGANIAIAVTGIAGPDGGTEEKPVGTVWIAIAIRNKSTFAYKELHARGRDIFKQTVTQRVLGKIREVVINN